MYTCMCNWVTMLYSEKLTKHCKPVEKIKIIINEKRGEYYSAIKKNEIMSFTTTWMQLEILKLSEVSQKEKDKYRMISLICVI